jgi:hypothetical protein
MQVRAKNVWDAASRGINASSDVQRMRYWNCSPFASWRSTLKRRVARKRRPTSSPSLNAMLSSWLRGNLGVDELAVGEAKMQPRNGSGSEEMGNSAGDLRAFLGCKSDLNFVRAHVDRRRAISPALDAVHVAKEFADERAPWFVVNVLRCTALLDATLVQDDDFIGEFEGFLLVVRHEDRGETGVVVKVAQPATEILANFCVERTKRLIEQ